MDINKVITYIIYLMKIFEKAIVQLVNTVTGGSYNSLTEIAADYNVPLGDSSSLFGGLFGN